MGGHGTASGGTAVFPEATLADLPYNVTSFNNDRGRGRRKWPTCSATS